MRDHISYTIEDLEDCIVAYVRLFFVSNNDTFDSKWFEREKKKKTVKLTKFRYWKIDFILFPTNVHEKLGDLDRDRFSACLSQQQQAHSRKLFMTKFNVQGNTSSYSWLPFSFGEEHERTR